VAVNKKAKRDPSKKTSTEATWRGLRNEKDNVPVNPKGKGSHDRGKKRARPETGGRASEESALELRGGGI